MSHDIALHFIPDQLRFDIAVAGNGDLAAEDGLYTAVILSLFCDARAQPGDDIPDGTQRKRGWWADRYSVIDNDRCGSRLWLLSRSKTTDATLESARAYAAEALQWLVDDGVARRVDVSATRQRDNMLVLEVAIYRADEPPIQFRFDDFWSDTHAV